MIRRLAASDTDAYIALRRRGLAEEPVAFAASLADDVTNDRDAIARGFDRFPELAVFGAFEGDALVGVAGVARDAKEKMRHKAGVFGMYVAPEARGRGHAVALLEAIVAHARAQAIRILCLTVAAEAPGARRLYERVGFRLWGTEPAALCIDGRYIDDHHLALDLAPHPAPVSTGGTAR